MYDSCNDVKITVESCHIFQELVALGAKLDANKDFLNDLAAQCKEKAAVKHQRMNARATELAALEQGIEILTGAETTQQEGRANVEDIAAGATAASPANAAMMSTSMPPTTATMTSSPTGVLMMTRQTKDLRKSIIKMRSKGFL